MYSFNGKFNYQLDEKNRIRIPPDFRDDLGVKFKMMCGTNGTISMMPNAEYEKILAGFGDVSYFDEEMQEFISEFTALVFDVKEDSVGRVIIPAELKDYANLQKEVVITGVATYVKIESKEAYDKRMQNKDVKSIFAKLKELRVGQ